MREHLRRLLPLALVLFVVGCGGPKADLRLRADLFGELLVEIAELSESTAKIRLERYLEPSPELESPVDKYYADFKAGSEKFTVVSQSIADLSLSSDETQGTVTFKTAVRLEDGREIAALQKTSWVLVDGEWYRTSKESEKAIGR